MSDGWRVSEGAGGTVIVTQHDKEIARLSERAAVKVRQGEAFLLSGGFSLRFTQLASMKGNFYVEKDIETTRGPDHKVWGFHGGPANTLIVTRGGVECAHLDNHTVNDVKRGVEFGLIGGFVLRFDQKVGCFYVGKDVRPANPERMLKTIPHIGSIVMAAVEILKERQHLGENSDIFPGKNGHSKAWRDRTLDECAMLAIELHIAIQRILAEMEPK